MKKKIYIVIGVVILVGVVAEAWHWLNQVPEVRLALVDEDKKPIPVTNDWRMALLDCVNIQVEEGIKQSVNSRFDRFDLNRSTGEVVPVPKVTQRFNWPLDLTKEPYNAPSSARYVHIKHLPDTLTFWQLKGADIVIIPVVAQGKYGLAGGFLAIDLPEKTIAGVRFYHSEDSPGLGQNVLLPEFGERFIGKRLFDDNGEYALKIIRPTETDKNSFEVDGISGATIMSNGIQEAFKFWVSKDAYASVLKLPSR
ncbi:MAG: hypothetical protein CSA50_05875 [Gammaproteobacteria bacterium]|nr:MAG: hypothetical protein CSA50_05875 [Gammaproteobacteria bacterium]